MGRLTRFWSENWLTIAVVAVLAVGYMALRSTPADVASADEVATHLQEGKPTLLYFYSNT